MKRVLIALVLMVSASIAHGQIKEIIYEPGIYAEISTKKGTIVLLLEYEKTPLTVANFVALAEGKMKNNAVELGTPYYDGIKFHRVIANFMIQGGDPRTNPANTEKKGLGYTFRDEFHPDLKHTGPGILSMANAGPGTNSSQFFITHVETPWLDNKHSVFGRVILGQDVVDRIKQGDKIISLRIKRVGEDAQKFDAPAVFNELKNK